MGTTASFAKMAELIDIAICGTESCVPKNHYQIGDHWTNPNMGRNTFDEDYVKISPSTDYVAIRRPFCKIAVNTWYN